MKKFLSLIILALLSLPGFSQVNYNTFGKSVSADGDTFLTITADPTGTRWYKLSNGLTVVLSVNKNQPRVQTLVAVKAGSKNDPADNTGLAHYLEHMLFKGTDSFGTSDFAQEKVYLDQIDQLYETYNKTKDNAKRKAIYRQIDSISGLASQYSIANEFDKMCQGIGAQGTNAFTSVEQTVYVNNIPSNRIHQWVEIESERYRNPVLRLFHTELEAVYEEKNISLDDDMSEAYEKLYASLFKVHPYGTQTTIGTIEHLKNPSLIKIREYFNTYYVPNNMAIVMVGDFNPDDVIYMIKRHFGYMKSKKVPPFTFKYEYPRGVPDSITVVGPDAASVMMAWRFEGVAHQQSDMVRIVDLILNNSKAGLIDLNLVKEQKVLSAGSFPDFMKDYSSHIMMGRPREGQSLEEVKDLILGEIEKIKKGDFDEELLKGIIANNMVDEIKSFENYQSVAYTLLDAFVTGRKWQDVLNTNYRMSKITKAQIMEFVKEYYNSGYTIVYKRTGEDEEKVKIEKPAISEVSLNRDKSSEFVDNILNEEIEEIEPVFINFEKDLDKGKIGNAEFLYKKNDANQLFTLYYVIDIGKYHDKKLSYALDYLEYLGTDKYSASELSMKFYKLACNFGVSVGSGRSYVYLNGPQQNFAEALALFEDLLANAKPDQKALKDYIDGVLKSRSDAKLSKRAISSALSYYALYGKNNPRTFTLNNTELANLKADELVKMIKTFTSYKHKVMYYGPETKESAISMISKSHKVGNFIPSPTEQVFKPIVNTKNTVYFVHHDMVQAEINWRNGGGVFDVAKIPYVMAFNEYFGGGMSSVVFQDIRESRALAYSTYASFYQSMEKGKHDFMLAYVGTQADKLNDAIKAMSDLLNNLPENEASFLQARDAILSNIESERIIKNDIFFTYLDAEKMGILEDYRKKVYETIQKLTFEEVKKFHADNVKNKAWAISVLGSREKISSSDLKKYGELKELTLEEIFGY